jgi:hypothetical protein
MSKLAAEGGQAVGVERLFNICLVVVFLHPVSAQMLLYPGCSSPCFTSPRLLGCFEPTDCVAVFLLQTMCGAQPGT